MVKAASVGGLCALVLVGTAGAGAVQEPAVVRVVIETTRGVIEADIDVGRAPVTAANFLKYVDAGMYDGGVFHRAVRPDTELRKDVSIQVIQGGRARGRGRGEGPAGFGPIPLERTSVTGLKHLDGVLSMARSGPDSATSDFFICVGDQPELDFGGRRNADGQGFAAFGRVAAGTEVVRAIQGSAVRAGTEALDPPIEIVRVRRRG